MSRASELSVRAILRIVTVVVLSALALYLVYLLRRPVGWVLLAAFIAVALSAPVNRLERHMRRGLAILLVYLAVVLVPVGLAALVVPPLVNQGTELVNHLPQYADDVREYVHEKKQLRELDAKYDITGELQKQAARLPNRIGDAAKVLGDIGLGLVSSLFALLNILILSVFLLAGGRRWIDSALQLRPEGERERARRILDQTAAAVSGYVQGALAVALIAGIQTFIVLTILGVPFAAPLAVIAGLASLIPLVGATVAAVLIGIVTLFGGFPLTTIIWAIWAIIYQQIENNLIQPQIQRRTVKVHPFVVLVAVLFGSTLLGIVGAIIAIPIAASIQILIREWAEWRREQREAAIVAPVPSPPPDGDEGAGGGIIVPT
jgi:predicted PurR-regulated permease PerM